MIKKIRFIRDFAVFKSFDWDKELLDQCNRPISFKEINVIYGRNYSGKTTLSRLIRALEIGNLSDKYDNPYFEVEFADNITVTPTDLLSHGKTIRVFNADFVKENLQFLSNPDDTIESFAILGDDNAGLMSEIKRIETELGSAEQDNETGLYAKRSLVQQELTQTQKAHQDAESALDKQLQKKAIDRNIGIRYQVEKFGNQNYDTSNLKKDLLDVLGGSYQYPDNEIVQSSERLIGEKLLPPVVSIISHSPQFENLTREAKTLIETSVSTSEKIDELVKEAALNQWVEQGLTLHKDKRETCAFCGNPITTARWTKLEKHFDEESGKLVRAIDTLVEKIKSESETIKSVLTIEKTKFYSTFHTKIDNLILTYSNVLSDYMKSLDNLICQLDAKKRNIFSEEKFQSPEDFSERLLSIWSSYEIVRLESESFSRSLDKERQEAQKVLRLKEVFDYQLVIQYQQTQDNIAALKQIMDNAENKKQAIDSQITHNEQLVKEKKQELNDEEKGAKKVTEYLHNFFGHHFLSLEPRENTLSDETGKQIQFEVLRDGKKAYHLSEGECNLLAFCYFLAKLEDTATKDEQPIIWIDDPVSSLDGNHIFFVYSLIYSEIVTKGDFSQLFLSTHNLNLLKYLYRLPGAHNDHQKREDKKKYCHLILDRKDSTSTLDVMPDYLRDHATEFNYLFRQIYQCAQLETVDDKNYTILYNFGNNARKFLELYLYYRYPDGSKLEVQIKRFFGNDTISTVLVDRIINEYSHLCGVFERGETVIDLPEAVKIARLIIETIKQKDKEQYEALVKSIG